MNTEIMAWQKRRGEIIKWMLENGYSNPNKNDSGPKSYFNAPNVKMKDLKVASIMDQFTLESYKPECKLLEVTPENWKEELESFHPDILFIESAWKGKNDLWYRKVAQYSRELEELTKYAHEKAIPVIFWNKEDPVYTDVFMLAASYADIVFTTDIDCIARYKAELGHDRVYHLHFAAQPVIHNPIEKYNRKEKFCFAGAYYHKYKERSKVFDEFSEVFQQNKGFEIYDRNYPNPLPEHAFPKQYNSCILGTLPSSKMDIAYKGYMYGVNMNSIQQSQTMFARRVFEMLASNTVTVGNFSRGLKNYFGDLTICTDDKKTLELYLDKYCSDTTIRNKYRLLGLRKVLTENLYEDRLGYITEKLYGKNMKEELPVITILSYIEKKEQAIRLMALLRKQTYKRFRIVFISDDAITDGNIQFEQYSVSQAKKLTIENCIKDDWVAVMDPCDWYGENYLKDIVLTLRYLKDADAIGKSSFFQIQKDGKVRISGDGTRYKNVDRISLRRGMLSKRVILTKQLWEIISLEEWKSNATFSVDEFNYCERYVGEYCEDAADIVLFDKGLDLYYVEHVAENIRPLEVSEGVLRFVGSDLAKTNVPPRMLVRFNPVGKDLKIDSDLPEGKHEYIYMPETRFEVAPWIKDGKLSVQFRGNGSLDLICVMLCYDKNNNKLSPVFPHLNRNELCQLPEGTCYVEFGFRPKGRGSANIKEIIIGADKESSDRTCYLTRSNILVLTNHYPAPEALYRNMFVHKRMTSYKKCGKVYDVMRMNPYAEECFREFEGINVVETKGSELINILDSGRIDTVCVHFLDREMWEILKGYVNRIRIIIWSHGSDIRPWWRKQCDYTNEVELNEAKKRSESTMALWKEVFMFSEKKQIYFVFVSKYFANEVMEDYKVNLEDRCSIIHNCIDVELFNYERKDPELRKKILTIKPFRGLNYANDLTAKGIIELSKRDCFSDIEIDIYGDGERFDKENKELKRFKNVKLYKKFLTQKEIAELHKNHGVFIATTRLDSQGVSRDEAMSSGLVPIANNCSAVPEFVDDKCGILIPPESYVEIADAIEKLYNDPKLFLKLSENAAKRVRSQTSKDYTIDKEIRLIEEKRSIT